MNRWVVAGAAVLLVLAVVMLATVRDYGITWDEQDQSIYGDLVIAWYQSGFHNDAALTHRNYLYSGLFDVFAQLVDRISPLDLYTDRHIVNVAFALAGLAGTWRLGVLVIGARGGFLAMGLAALTPMFYGHSFNNPKDVPFAAAFVWTLCFLLESARSIPNIRRSSTAKLTTSFGALLAIRPGGIFVFGYIAVWWLLSFLRRAISPRAAIRKTVVPLAIVLGGAWLVMLCFWPWGQVSPILNPLRGMRRAARFAAFTGTTLFFGQQVPARPAPMEYIPTWFALQLPETYLLALTAGLLSLAVRRNVPMIDADRQRAVTLRFLGFVVLFPIVAAILLRSTLYDAVRHFLFVIPPLAVLAAAAIENSLRPPTPRTVRAAVVAGTLATAALTARDMAALHPYESVYFNRLIAGGLPGIEGRFETDYWGNSVREGAEWVVKNVPGKGIRIANCSNPLQTSYYLRGAEGTRFIAVPLEQNPDILLATTRWDCHRKAGARTLHTIERQGVPLLYVLDLRPKSRS